jgi:Zn-dependent M16 (insulinase) family peptidase
MWDDSGIATTLEHVCVLGSNDQTPVVATLEYVS